MVLFETKKQVLFATVRLKVSAAWKALLSCKLFPVLFDEVPGQQISRQTLGNDWYDMWKLLWSDNFSFKTVLH